MKKFKLMIFILLTILLILTLFYSVFGNSISFLSLKEIKENRKLNKELINELKINNVDAVYDKDNNVYYYTIPDKYENNIYALIIDLSPGYKYKIIDETLNIIKVNYDKQLKIIIYNKDEYYETKLQLTQLPLISILTPERITKDDINSSFKYVNQNDSQKVINHNIKIHSRGSTSTIFPKKSYKIEFYNKKFTKDEKVYISNFYYGDALILDAVYRDPSKVRNLLAIELWNDISNDFTNVDIYNEFVEVFINNKYVGLYILTEPINRNKLNLNKNDNFDTSIILKVNNWGTVTNKIDFSKAQNNTFISYEMKYPNEKEMFAKSWQKILTKLANYYDLGAESNYETINSTWNIKNYVDLIMFNAVINNIDNKLQKNNYFYMNSLNSDEVFIQPWDMEYSFGLHYKANDEKLISKVYDDYTEIYTSFIHGNSDEINKLLILRYKELRKNILTKEYFDNKLNNYINKLNKGSALRDSKIWYEYEIEKEIEEIRTWIYNRLDYMDEYIEGLENEES